ncbi:MAG: nuclear transport factor 2 family protein [Gemmatimonadaceae bacterium]
MSRRQSRASLPSYLAELRNAGLQDASRATVVGQTLILEDHTIPDRQFTERLLRGLYAARVSGDIDAVYEKFLPDAHFEIAGASHSTPLAVTANGASEYRPLLAIMIKTFKLRDQEVLSLLIDGERAAVHWRASILSRLTGTSVLTELVDIVEIRDNRIGSYIEFFAPR